MGTTHCLFLLRHLLVVKRLFWWKNFSLNKEHSRPFEQCWPLRDHLVLCESSSALQTFYHMKNNWWRLLKTVETPEDGVENVLSFEIYVRLYHVHYIRALDSRKWLINQSSFGEKKNQQHLSYRKQDNLFLSEISQKGLQALAGFLATDSITHW